MAPTHKPTVTTSPQVTGSEQAKQDRERLEVEVKADREPAPGSDQRRTVTNPSNQGAL